jgi:hypothetical protein
MGGFDAMVMASVYSGKRENQICIVGAVPTPTGMPQSQTARDSLTRGIQRSVGEGGHFWSGIKDVY